MNIFSKPEVAKALPVPMRLWFLNAYQKPLTECLTRLMIPFDDEPSAHLTDLLLHEHISKWFGLKLGVRTLQELRIVNFIRFERRSRLHGKWPRHLRNLGLKDLRRAKRNTGASRPGASSALAASSDGSASEAIEEFCDPDLHLYSLSLSLSLSLSNLKNSVFGFKETANGLMPQSFCRGGPELL
jgi:hypothetical protein